MYTCLKPYLNCFEQWMQQGDSGGVKILKRLKIGKCNIRLGCNKGKLEKNK